MMNEAWFIGFKKTWLPKVYIRMYTLDKNVIRMCSQMFVHVEVIQTLKMAK